MSKNELVLVTDRQYAIRQGIGGGTEAGIRKLAFDIEARAKANVTAVNAIDTGAMKASIHTDIRGSAGYPGAFTKAASAATTIGRHSGKANKGFAMFPQEKAGPMEAIVAVGAVYALNVEFGTVGKGARPFFGPAVTMIMNNAPVTIVSEINKSLPDR